MPISIADLKARCLLMQQLDDQLKELSAKKKFLDEEYNDLEKEVMLTLDEELIDRFDFGNGLVFKANHISIGKENPSAFKAWMVEKGLWDNMADINSNTLKSFVKREKDKAESEGNYDYKIPGLSISEITKLNMRRN